MKLIAWEMRRINWWRYVCVIKLAESKEGGGHLNLHADTCTGGPEFVLIDGTTSKVVEVSGFSKEFGPIRDIPVGTCATAYDDPDTGSTVLLMFGEMLYFGDRLSHSLLCPNQIRSKRNIVEDTPKQFDLGLRHGMTLKNVETEQEIFIPFRLRE